MAGRVQGEDGNEWHDGQFLSALSSAGFLNDLDNDQIELLEQRLKEVRRERNRPGPPKLPRRALALDAIDTLGVPASPRLISWMVDARTGEPFDARSLAAARRDDRAAWDRERDAGRTPSPKLAPALHHEMLEPVRALVTNSVWPLHRRIVSPHSLRADHPAALLAVLDEADRLDDVDPDTSARLTSLAGRLSVGLPGAGRISPTGPEARAGLRAVAQEEYDRFAAEAASEREAAALRCEMIEPVERIWGRVHTDDPARRRAQGR